MPFPVHPRAGHSMVMPSSAMAAKEEESPSKGPSGRNVLLASLSLALALALCLILAFQFGLLQRKGSQTEQFSEVRIRVGEEEEFSIFGRRLAVADGDYFLDIPYAVGTGRFQQAQLAPLPRNFYAVYYGNGCPNGFTRTRAYPDLNWNPPPLETVSVSEQCHTLNIYRCQDARSTSQLLPVLVVINEGDWLKRSNANLEPSAVVQRLACNGVGGADGGGSGMLVVSLNYRMGPFGHFRVPGWPQQRRNFGLWDIRLGLEWIQQNIVHFGGHRAHVTLLARGHGARLASLLQMLPQGRGLFKRQVLLSGSAFSATLLQPNAPMEAGFDPSMHLAIAANCANEREWQALMATAEVGATTENATAVELRARVEKCMAELSPEALVAAESRVRAPSFLRWPILTGGGGGGQEADNNFTVPATNPFSDIPPMASLIGFCSQPNENVGNSSAEPAGQEVASERFRRRLEEALRDELGERLGQMADLRRAPNGIGSEVIRHYLDTLEAGLGSENAGKRDPEEMFEKIKADFLLAGPAMLDAFLRARLANARVYGFSFRPPPSLNISLLDAAEFGARNTNQWASAQPVCVDDLLFNWIPDGVGDDGLRQSISKFADRLAAFVAFGEPNPEEARALVEWPTAFPRSAEGPIGAAAPKWLRLEEDRVETGAEQLLLGNVQFWLCQLPKRLLGLGTEICVERR